MTIEDIDKQIEVLQKAREKAIAGQGKLLMQKLYTIDSLTREGKCMAFNKLWAIARDYIDSIKLNGYGNSDAPHYIFEAAISECLGPHAWGVIREFENG